MSFLKPKRDAGPFPKVTELAEVVEAEMRAIEAGGIEGLPELLTRKSALTAEVEALGPQIEGYLSRRAAGHEALREAIAHLRALIERENRLVKRVSSAAREAAADLRRASGREALGGLYDARGSRRGQGQMASILDQSL